jgi:hypothetical protein
MANQINFFLFIFLVSFSSIAQQKVALQSNGNTTIYGGANPFLDAYNAAQDGDTIYLPGGNIPFPNIIDKKLVIYGAGFHPDSTTATQKTILNGTLTIQQNADNLHLEGIEIVGTLRFSSYHQVDNIVVKRCKLGSIQYEGYGECVNNQFQECIVVGDIQLTSIKSGLISNSFIGGRIINGMEMEISNNIFFYNDSYWGYYVINNLDNSYISNNIFMRELYANNIESSCELSTFTKNVFRANPPTGTNTFVDNYIDTDLTIFFINQSGFSFDFTHNYHLQNPSSFLGTDGNEVGVFGGFFPFKEGMLPVNPHIQYKNIAPQTNNNGELQIEIKVNAQNE